MTAPTSRTPVTETAAQPRRKALNPIVKFILELGPLALFFIVYGRLGIFAATGVLMASVLVTLGVSYAMLRRIPIMPLVTAVIVLIFGSLTLIFHDETLIKIKPTALYVLFAAALFVGLWLNKPLLKILFDGAIQVTDEGWRKLTWRWAFFFWPRGAQRDRLAHPDDRPLGQVQDLRLPAAHASVRGLPGAPDHEIRSQGRGSERRTLRGAEAPSSEREPACARREDNRGASWGQINPRKTKQKGLDFLAFSWPNWDFSMGYSESKVKSFLDVRLASRVVRKDLRRLPFSRSALQSALPSPWFSISRKHTENSGFWQDFVRLSRAAARTMAFAYGGKSPRSAFAAKAQNPRGKIFDIDADAVPAERVRGVDDGDGQLERAHNRQNGDGERGVSAGARPTAVPRCGNNRPSSPRAEGA